jgi:hypothetical protein
MVTGYFSQKQADFCGRTAKYWNKDKTAVIEVTEIDSGFDPAFKMLWDDAVCVGELYTDETGLGGFISSDLRSENNMKIIKESKLMNPFSGEGKRRMDSIKKSRYM